jgi:hypothetical protein
MSGETVGLVLSVLAEHSADAISENLSFATFWPFAGAQLHRAPNGSTVINNNSVMDKYDLTAATSTS